MAVYLPVLLRTFGGLDASRITAALQNYRLPGSLPPMRILNRAKKLLTNSEVLAMVSDSTSAMDSKTRSRIHRFCAGSVDPQKCALLRRELARLGLTEFETVNLINIMPKGLVHLQNIVEEMVGRLTDKQMAEILGLLH